MTTSKSTKIDPATLNKPEHIIWFDDFNEEELKTPTNQYRFLSNFYVGKPFTMPDLVWAGPAKEPIEFKTGEHAFQAFKAWLPKEFADITYASTPGKAKKLGRSCELRPDWEVVKFDVMMAVLRSKFTLDRNEGSLLLGTGLALLTEGTFWYDDTWGVMLNKPKQPGRNWLGTLLMARRAELQAERENGVQMATGEHNISWALEPH